MATPLSFFLQHATQTLCLAHTSITQVLSSTHPLLIGFIRGDDFIRKYHWPYAIPLSATWLAQEFQAAVRGRLSLESVEDYGPRASWIACAIECTSNIYCRLLPMSAWMDEVGSIYLSLLVKVLILLSIGASKRIGRQNSYHLYRNGTQNFWMHTFWIPTSEDGSTCFFTWKWSTRVSGWHFIIGLSYARSVDAIIFIMRT